MGSAWSFISDLFGISSDGYTIEPRSYKDSNFRAIYKKTPKNQTIESVLKGLNKLNNKEFAQFFNKYSIKENKKQSDDEKYEQIEVLSAGETAVICWTLQRPKFYGTLKGVLITDDKSELIKWMPFIRALNSKLVCQNPPKMKCYRGSKMSLEDFSVFKQGYVYRIPYYVATSTDEDVAKSWPGSNYLIQFNIDEKCPNAASVAKLSVFPHEKEVLLPPYTAVRVVGKSANMMIVDVLDNLTAPKDVVANVMKVDSVNIAKMSQLAGLSLYGGLAGTAVAALNPLGAAVLAIGSIGGMAVIGTGSVGMVGADTKVKFEEDNKFVD